MQALPQREARLLLTGANGNFASGGDACWTPSAEAPLSEFARSFSLHPRRMSWWSRMMGGKPERSRKPQRLDYLNEALALERQGDFDAALTSYRLALRDQPNDPRIIQNMAIAFSKTGQLDEAVRTYRRALDLDPQLSGAHYGLAFLLLKRGDTSGAKRHLHAFLSNPPKSVEADRWIKHAQLTLSEMEPGSDSSPVTELE